MKELILKRVARNSYATYGVFVLENEPIAVSLELPWRNNSHQVSCIPAGMYICKQRTSEKYGAHYHVMGVAGRDLILIHPGNLDDDTKGCILPGRSFGPVWSKNDLAMEYGVQDSVTAMHSIRELMGRNRFWLNVINMTGRA